MREIKGNLVSGEIPVLTAYTLIPTVFTGINAFN